MIEKDTILFLKNLAANNNKPWFDDNRRRYDAAKENFLSFIQQLITNFSRNDPSIGHLRASECVYRINRDVRFSKDKTPYKNHFGAYINAQGKKSPTAGYYFHLEPGNSFTGGGMWQPPAPMLAKVRQEIDYNASGFLAIVHSPSFLDNYGPLTMDDMLQRVPKGYEADNPMAQFLKLKSFVAVKKIPDTLLLSNHLTAEAATSFQVLQPLVNFLNLAID